MNLRIVDQLQIAFFCNTLPIECTSIVLVTSSRSRVPTLTRNIGLDKSQLPYLTAFSRTRERAAPKRILLLYRVGRKKHPKRAFLHGSQEPGMCTVVPRTMSTYVCVCMQSLVRCCCAIFLVTVRSRPLE